MPDIKLVNTIADVTLESYIVQFISITAFEKIAFPVGITYHFITTIAVAFCLHFISQLILGFVFRKRSRR